VLGVLLLGLILTQSKSGVLAVLAGAVVVALLFLLDALWRKRAARASARRAAATIVPVAIGLVLLSYAWSWVYSLVVADFAGRLVFTRQAMRLYAEATPLEQLLGLGFRGAATINPLTAAWTTAHNSYASFLAELGPIGFALVIAVLLTMLAGFHRQGGWHWLAGLFVVLLHLATETFIYGPMYVLLLAGLYALSGGGRVPQGSYRGELPQAAVATSP
jgi:hypothetical protein